MKFLEKLVDFLNYLKIMVSPTLIGLFIGIIVYANKTDEVGFIIAIGIAVCGIICGILWANWAKRKGGTTEFMARINSSTDIDEAMKNHNEENNKYEK
jgi:hypothetical protein